MIGRFGDQVTHLPTGKRGKVVMPSSGVLGIFATAVQLEDGQVKQFPDPELRVCQENGPLQVTGMRFSSNRPFPDHMQISLVNNGDGTVTVTGQVPGSPMLTVHNLPIQEGEIVLPDEVFLPIR